MGIPLDYAIRNLGRSPTRLLLSLVGSTLVVLLVLAAGGFVRGMDRSLTLRGGQGNVMLFGAGSEESVERSEISPAVPSLVAANVPGIRTRLGVPYVSPEVHMQTTVQRTPDDETNRQVLVRGVTPTAWLVHSGSRVAEGRAPEAGRDEIVVGRLAYRRLGMRPDELTIGSQLWFDDRFWTVVGIFEFPGSVTESEIWCPLTDLQIAARRDNLSCVVATIDGEDGFDDADAFAKQRLDLELVAQREQTYYAKLAGFFAPVRAMVWATAVLIASGGLLGGLNTMYAAFASRVREVGALQAMGFSRRTIVKSLVQESVLAAMAGTVLALLIGITLLDGVTVQFSMGAFGLAIDGSVVLLGVAAGLAVGLLGAVPPAVRCLRLPITDALKS
ncbi:MAG TPA: ABC transporter permease [Tepidisphaeraceae bacterium]|jgi:ABC-type lipoprotein release transport system permease subunit|nr:ABC transporter permease [Tepidisphaeraceae bacterium]